MVCGDFVILVRVVVFGLYKAEYCAELLVWAFVWVFLFWFWILLVCCLGKRVFVC